MASSFTTNVTDKNFEDEVLKSDKLVLIDFYADWCGPCKTLSPALEKFAEENQDTVKVVKVNVESNPELVEKFQIKSIPVLATMKDGKGLIHMVGLPRDVTPQELLRQMVAYSQPKPPLNMKPTAASCPVDPKPAGKGPTP